jgi:hypothetical protein
MSDNTRCNSVMPCCSAVLVLTLHDGGLVLGNSLVVSSIDTPATRPGYTINFSTPHSAVTAQLRGQEAMNFCPVCGTNIRDTIG